MISKGAAPPRLWIVAGPNGSGKSTAYGRSDVSEFDGSVWIINPDLLTARLRASERLDRDAANLEAVRRIEAWLDASIDVHQTIGVETVLSTPKYRRLVLKAKERGFEVRLIYVYVDTLNASWSGFASGSRRAATTSQQTRWLRAASAHSMSFRGSSGRQTKLGCLTIREQIRS